MNNRLLTIATFLAMLAIIQALGLVPPQVVSVLGILGQDIQNKAIEGIGPEKYALYQADQAIAAAHEDEQELVEQTAANRVDYEVALAKFNEVQSEEASVRYVAGKMTDMLHMLYDNPAEPDELPPGSKSG